MHPQKHDFIPKTMRQTRRWAHC